MENQESHPKITQDNENVEQSNSAVGISNKIRGEIPDMLWAIHKKEPEAAEVLFEIIKHIHGTYSDKYQSEVTDWLDTKALLLSKNGKFANLHSASKYIQRYSTIGFEKSENRIDLLKAAHYLFFELQRSKKFGKTNP